MFRLRLLLCTPPSFLPLKYFYCPYKSVLQPFFFRFQWIDGNIHHSNNHSTNGNQLLRIGELWKKQGFNGEQSPAFCSGNVLVKYEILFCEGNVYIVRMYYLPVRALKKFVLFRVDGDILSPYNRLQDEYLSKTEIAKIFRFLSILLF